VVGGQFGDVSLGLLDVLLGQRDVLFARAEGVAAEEFRLDFAAALEALGDLPAVQVSLRGQPESGAEAQHQRDEREVEAEVLLEIFHVA